MLLRLSEKKMISEFDVKDSTSHSHHIPHILRLSTVMLAVGLLVELLLSCIHLSVASHTSGALTHEMNDR